MNSNTPARERAPTKVVSLSVMGRRTTVRLEPELADALYEISARENCSSSRLCTLAALCADPGVSVTSAIRTFILGYFMEAATADGHDHAGHGSFERLLQRENVSREMLQEASAPLVGRRNREGSR